MGHGWEVLALEGEQVVVWWGTSTRTPALVVARSLAPAVGPSQMPSSDGLYALPSAPS